MSFQSFQELSERGGERLSLGVAARLSRYLQVLTQAKKMGKETISSQELADYTHVNSTQIRRDLSGFGKFGKRGVGYNVDSLVSQIRKILRTAGQHNIALFGAGHLGRAIASSDIFADHGFRVVAIFDADPQKVGDRITDHLVVRPYDEVKRVVADEEIVVGVLAVPVGGGPAGGGRPGRGRGEDHLQLLGGAAPGAARGDGAHLEPRRRPALRALLLFDLMLDMDRAREVFEDSEDFTVGIEEEFQILDPQTLDLTQRFEELQDAAKADPPLAESITGELIASEIEIRSGRGATFADAVAQQHDMRLRLFRLAAEQRRAAGRHRHPPVEPVAGAADHRHRALPPPRGGAQVRRLAQQHVLAARARGRARRRPGDRRVRSPARAAARPAGGLGELAVPRRARLGPALRAHADLHEELSALRRARAVGELGRRTPTSSTSSSATNSIVEHTQLWWSVRPHHAFGTVEFRICDAQTRAEDSTALAGLITACIAQAALDYDDGALPEPVAGRYIEENMWRAIRYGLDGRMIDFERARGVRRARDPRAAAGMDGARAGAARASSRRCRRRTAPSASAARRRTCARPSPPRST